MSLISFANDHYFSAWKRKDEWSVPHLIIGLIRPLNLVMMHVFRLFGVVYQMWFQEVRDGCLSWRSDTMELTRTPFAPTCWREIGTLK